MDIYPKLSSSSRSLRPMMITGQSDKLPGKSEGNQRVGTLENRGLKKEVGQAKERDKGGRKTEKEAERVREKIIDAYTESERGREREKEREREREREREITGK